MVIYFLLRARGLSYSLFLTFWAYFIPKDLLAAVNTFKLAGKFEPSYFWIQSYQMRPILEKKINFSTKSYGLHSMERNMLIILFWPKNEERKWRYLCPWALNKKNKTTLFSTTFKVEENKVVLFFSLGAQGQSYGHFLNF